MPSGILSEPDASSLVERISQGDRSAEEVLATIFRPRVVEFGAIRTGNRDVGQDLAQEVLLAVLGALRKGQLREPDKLAGFVYGTARNLLNNQLRKQSREQTSSLAEDVEHPNPNSTVDHYEEEDRERKVLSALKAFDSTDRQILSLSLVEGLKPGEIAAQLKLAGDVVRQRKTRLLRKLVSQIGAARPLSSSENKP